METAKIEIILRALELGSLTKAAEKYDYTPSAISQMVSSLEDELGRRLIVRSYSGVSVAEGMEDVVKLLWDMVKTKNRIMKAVEDKNRGERSLTIATYASISKYILPGAVKKYKETHPNIDINIIVSDSLGELYKKGLADLLFGERIKAESAFDKVLTDPYLAILPMSYEECEPCITRDELLSGKFIMPKDNNISDYLKRSASEESPLSNSNDDSSVIELVRADMGISILSSIAITGVKDIRTRELVPPLVRELGFMYNKDELREKKYISEFMDFLTEYIKEARYEKSDKR